jgi:predicted transcriptional regulator
MSLVGVKTRSNNTQADIQEVVQSEISKYLMSSDFKELLRDSFKEALSGMIAQVVKPFEEKIIKLEEKVLQLEEKCNDNEQYSRRYNVRIYGVNNSTSADSYGYDAKEDCFKTVIEFCRNELGIEVKHEEIDRAHRVGKPNRDGARALIVKFKSYESKRKIMINKRKLKGKKLYVNEDLTWLNQQLLKRVRDAIVGKAYVFTADGYILVKDKPDRPPVRIRRDSDLLRYDFE